MKAFATRFPFLFGVTTTLVAMLCLLWPLWIPGLSQTVQVLLGRTTICLFAASLLTHLCWWQEAGFVRPTNWRIVLPYLPILLIIILAKTSDIISSGIHVTDVKLILLGLVVYMAGGFMEEAVFRGVVLRALLPSGLIRAAFLSALIFGIVHLLNLVGGANVNATILQVVVAFLMGLVFMAPLAITHNIWPLVIIHGLNNFVGYLVVGGFLNTAPTSKEPSFVEVVGSVLPFLVLAIYSLWLLRRAERQSITFRSSTASKQIQAGPS